MANISSSSTLAFEAQPRLAFSTDRAVIGHALALDAARAHERLLAWARSGLDRGRPANDFSHETRVNRAGCFARDS
jgi:hypothetical protein